MPLIETGFFYASMNTVQENIIYGLLLLFYTVFI